MALYKEQSDDVNFVHPEYLEYANSVELVNNIFNGIDSSAQYLLKASREGQDGFDDRVSNATLKNFVKRATEAFVGMIYRKPVQLIGYSDYLKGIFNNVDRSSTIGKFARDLTTTLIRDGKVFIAVDTQINGSDPYVIIMNRENVINWRKDSDGNFKLLVYKEVINDEAGNFGIEVVIQWRVYKEDGIVELWRKKDDGALYIYETIKTEFTYIPIVEATLDDIPPLYDIAKLTVKHLNRTSLKDKYLDMAATPIPVIWGESDDSTNGSGYVIGVDEAFIFSGTKDEADFQWRELSGSSIKALQEDLAVIEADITSGIIRASTSESSSIKTATQAFYEAAESSNRVTVISNLIEVALNKVSDMIIDISNDAVNNEETARIVVNKDFNALAQNTNDIRLLWEVYLGGVISVETFLKSLETHELVDIGSVDDEVLRIELDKFVPEPKDMNKETMKNSDNRTPINKNVK